MKEEIREQNLFCVVSFLRDGQMGTVVMSYGMANSGFELYNGEDFRCVSFILIVWEFNTTDTIAEVAFEIEWVVLWGEYVCSL